MSKDQQKIKKEQRKKRHLRFRKRISGTSMRPRISVFRSNKHIQAQLIDDGRGATLLSVSDKEIKGKSKSKTDLAFKAGLLLAEKAKKIKVCKAIFDKSGYKFHGRVKALASGAREGGLKF